MPISLHVLSLVGALIALAAGCGGSAAPAPRTDSGDVIVPPAVTVPAKGGAATLDIASWNIEWFGESGNGPTDEALQLRNVRDVIKGTDADVWGVAEVVNGAHWDALEAQLPGYSGFLANEATVEGGAASYSASEQKVGILFKTSVASLVSARIILREHDHAFAGRPPLEVRLRTTVSGVSEDLVVVVLHMKAFADEASWQRRQDAGNALKAYLDATWPTQKVIVVGDWNDDVDASILPGKPTPYAALIGDAARYRFVTAPLSAQGISSTTGYPDLIDHHLATNELAAREVANSVTVYTLDALVPSYDRTTSDHYPVLSRYQPGAP